MNPLLNRTCHFLPLHGLSHSGYYTRSGYVPGPICKYNWTKVWEVADSKNKYEDPMASVSYILFILNPPY